MDKRSTGRSNPTIALALAILVLAISLSLEATAAESDAYQRPGSTTRASQVDEAADSDGYSYAPSMSADGRYIAFLTEATDLVVGDTNGSQPDVVVADRFSAGFVRVSISSDGTPGNSSSKYPSLTPDGRYVVFESDSTNLVSGDTNQSADVFVHDRDADQDGVFDEPGAITTERVSVATGGRQAVNGVHRSGPGWHIGPPSVSPDGRYVVFPSISPDVVEGDTNGVMDVFLHDRAQNITERLSVASDGTQGNDDSGTRREVGAGSSSSAVVSADGRSVVFWSTASNLVPDDTNGEIDVFVRDGEQGTTRLISTTESGEQADAPSFDPTITGDGRYVAFTSAATNLTPVDNPDGAFLDDDVFLRDRDADADGIFDEPGAVGVRRMSVASDGTEANGRYSGQATVSSNGRYVTFASDATNLVAGDENERFDVFIHDVALGVTERISIAAGDTEGEDVSWLSTVAADGRYVGFETSASSLTPTYKLDSYDVLLRDRGPESGVGEINAVADGSHTRVSGWVTFSGESLSSSTDPDDASPVTDEVGGDLRGAELIYRAEQRDLLIRIRPETFPTLRTPCCVRRGTSGSGATTYGLDITTEHGRYQVRATMPAETLGAFELHRCDSTCTNQATLSGTFGTSGAEVLVAVPLSSLGITDRAELSELRAFSELAGGTELDEIDLGAARIPARTIGVGLSPSGTPTGEVSFEKGDWLQSGRFSVPIDTSGFAPGSYDVWARACLGQRCGARATTVQIGGTPPGGSTGDIEDLTAKVTNGKIRVTGKTTLSEAVVLGTDPIEPSAALPGSDLTAANIGFKNPQTLVFKLDVANLGPLGGTPESVRYGWDFTVTPPYKGLPYEGRYELLAMRTQAGEASRPGELSPTFRLYDSFKGQSFARRLLREVRGKINNGIVEWEVLLSDIDAKPGAVIAAVPPSQFFGQEAGGGVTAEHVVVNPVASAYNQAFIVPLDRVAAVADYEIPRLTVDVGIVDADVPDDEVELTTAGKVATNGLLVADVPVPQTAGTYKIVARSCLRDQCVVGSTRVTILPALPEVEGTILSFTAANAESGQHSDAATFGARLTSATGSPLQGAELTFELAGAESSRSFTGTTDDDGAATITTVLEEKPGAHLLTVRFAGDEDHAGDADTVSFVVEKEDTAVELSVEGRGGSMTLRAYLTDLDSPGDGIAGRTIDFYSDGEAIGSAETGSDGVAEVPVPPGHRGNNRTYEAVFAGDGFFLPSSGERQGQGTGSGAQQSGDREKGFLL